MISRSFVFLTALYFFLETCQRYRPYSFFTVIYDKFVSGWTFFRIRSCPMTSLWRNQNFPCIFLPSLFVYRLKVDSDCKNCIQNLCYTIRSCIFRPDAARRLVILTRLHQVIIDHISEYHLSGCVCWLEKFTW